MSVTQILQAIDKLTSKERSEVGEYLAQRLVRDRERKLESADHAMKRMDAGGGVPIEKVWAVMEERERDDR